MIPDIPAKLLQLLRALFAQHPAIQTVRLFGSRVDGRSHPQSDIDLAIEGPLLLEEMSRLRLEMEELPTLCRFDLIHLDSLQNPDLHDRITQEGVFIFQKAQ
jgi:predicted nucleotidyltransferase